MKSKTVRDPVADKNPTGKYEISTQTQPRVEYPCLAGLDVGGKELIVSSPVRI